MYKLIMEIRTFRNPGLNRQPITLHGCFFHLSLGLNFSGVKTTTHTTVFPLIEPPGALLFRRVGRLATTCWGGGGLLEEIRQLIFLA